MRLPTATSTISPTPHVVLASIPTSRLIGRDSGCDHPGYFMCGDFGCVPGGRCCGSTVCQTTELCGSSVKGESTFSGCIPSPSLPSWLLHNSLGPLATPSNCMEDPGCRFTLTASAARTVETPNTPNNLPDEIVFHPGYTASITNSKSTASTRPIPVTYHTSALSPGSKAGIVIGSLTILIAIFALVRCYRRNHRDRSIALGSPIPTATWPYMPFVGGSQESSVEKVYKYRQQKPLTVLNELETHKELPMLPGIQIATIERAYMSRVHRPRDRQTAFF